MHAHEYVFSISDLAAHKSNVRVFVDLILECVKPELTVFSRELRGCHTLDE